MSDTRNRDLLRQGNAFATTTAYNERLRTKTSKLECIGVGSGKDGCVYLYCSDCGATFRKTKSKIRPSNTNRLICPHCEELYISIKKKERQQDILNRKAERHTLALIRQAQRERPIQRICKECGQSFDGKGKEMYCSNSCRNRANNRMKYTNRRMTIKANLVDKDISLKRLSIRDNNKCWLCKRLVDWNDCYHSDEGYFIVGENYPSIDHVVALANGGKHSWDNVRLAHHKCNTDKRDKLYAEAQNGQIILFC